MKKDWTLTQDAFDSLLNWLDADREQAAMKYEAIRLRLIKIFTCRGCTDAEELADETINRVTARVEEIAKEYQGEPARYFYGVCRHVYHEYQRKINAHLDLDSVTPLAAPPAGAFTDEVEAEYTCLENCLDRLPTSNRELVVKYYQQEKQAKIQHRKRLAQELGIAVNALRIRAHRIRSSLEHCVKDCVQQQPVH